MIEQGDHVVLRCTGDDCGMRYPCPADHPRRANCPLCEAATEQVDVYPPVPTHRPSPGSSSTTLVGVLDSIRSALNVGTMLRSADGAALDHVHLCGLTAGPDHPKVIKTALGAHQSVPTSTHPDISDCVATLQADGFEIWAIDVTESSQPIESIRAIPDRLAFVVGNELAGLDPLVLQAADRHVHLKMWGAKSTVNVGVTFGMVAYWLRTLAP